MFVELIATVFAGIACAGVAMLLNIMTGRRLPKWIMPVSAGLGMIAMTISNEYTWFKRTADRLPEGLEIATTVEEQGWLRPWTPPTGKTWLNVFSRGRSISSTTRVLMLRFWWSPKAGPSQKKAGRGGQTFFWKRRPRD